MDWCAAETWESIRRPVAESATLPPSAYSDDDYHEAERSAIFAGGWVGAAMSGDLDQAGRVLVRRVGGVSVLITRHADGDIRAFFNACAHRGTELVAEDVVVGRVIRCPYHRWSYDLDGSLVSTPLFDEVPVSEFDPVDFGLRKVRAETFAGVVWVSLADDVEPVAEWFGDLGQRFQGYGIERFSVVESATYEVAADWKLLTENFQEYYHLTWVHPELAKVSRVRDHYRFQGPGRYCGQTTTPVSGDERDEWTALPPAPGLSDSDAVSGRHVALFPNVMISLLPNHACTFLLEPLGSGRTRERITWSVPHEPDPQAFAELRQFWVDVNNEDIDICERAQRGISAGRFGGGRLSPRFEEPLHRFYNMLADRFVGVNRLPDGDPSDADPQYGEGTNPVPWVEPEKG